MICICSEMVTIVRSLSTFCFSDEHTQYLLSQQMPSVQCTFINSSHDAVVGLRTYSSYTAAASLKQHSAFSSSPWHFLPALL